MAYDASNDVVEEIAMFDKNNRGDKIRVTRITKKVGNSAFVDVREMFTADNGDVKPRPKGIRINSELTADVIIAMIKALNDDEDTTKIINSITSEDSDLEHASLDSKD